MTHNSHLAPKISLVEKVARASESVLRVLLWGIIVFGFAVWAVTLLDWFAHPLALSPYSNNFGGSPIFRAFALFVGAPFIAAIAILVLKKHPRHMIGLLLLVWAGCIASFGTSVDLNPLFMLFLNVLIGVWWGALILSPFYFPDGRAYPRWISPILTFYMFLLLVWGFSEALSQPTLSEAINTPNPIYVQGMAGVSSFLVSLVALILAMLALGVFLSPVFRYRRADAVQRQQIKWFVWCTAILLVPYMILYVSVTSLYPDVSFAPPAVKTFAQIIVPLIGFYQPIVIVFAILRHRLFDIDVIIRRTLIYGALSVLLTLLFFAGVAALQQLFVRLTGQQSDIALVLSTLAIAAVALPLRNRIQAGVDRRFYRRKFDAQQALEAFTARLQLQDEADIEGIAGEVRAVMNQTVQPKSVRVYLADTSAAHVDGKP